ncbi:MAG: YdeI/OmpD-associated family protein, partial [Planctomycetota bacterium]
PGKQRQYNEHVSEAKREETKLKRVEKIKPMILEGVGLHDKYKNC